MPEYFIQKSIKVEVRVVCGDRGTADVLASCLDEWCVDLLRPVEVDGSNAYFIQPRGSFFKRKEELKVGAVEQYGESERP